MKTLRVNHVEFCLLDDEDYEIYKSHSWHRNNSGYLRRTVHNKSIGKDQTVFIHRLIMNIQDPEIQVDHINGNKLDNQKSNLRLCTSQENKRNRKKNIKKKYSEYKGVDYDPRLKKRPWSVSIALGNNKRIRYGKFKTDRDAAIEYNKLATMHFGEFAQLNIIKEEEDI